MVCRVSRGRAKNFRFAGRQFLCLGISDCFAKAGFIAVAQLFCLSICFGFKKSPKVIHSIFPPRRVFDKALLKLPGFRLEKGETRSEFHMSTLSKSLAASCDCPFVSPSEVKTDIALVVNARVIVVYLK